MHRSIELDAHITERELRLRAGTSSELSAALLAAATRAWRFSFPDFERGAVTNQFAQHYKLKIRGVSQAIHRVDLPIAVAGSALATTTFFCKGLRACAEAADAFFCSKNACMMAVRCVKRKVSVGPSDGSSVLLRMHITV